MLDWVSRVRRNKDLVPENREMVPEEDAGGVVVVVEVEVEVEADRTRET